MEEKPYVASYSPTIMAGNSLLANLAFVPAVSSALAGAWAKIVKKESFGAAFKEGITSKVNWGLAAAFGLWSAYGEYKVAKHINANNNQLLADNIAMRSQLNQTSQILFHVANEVEKGTIPDSAFTMHDATPPSHVARLEATKAEHALAEAAHPKEPPQPAMDPTAHAEREKKHASHADQIASEKAHAAEASPTIH